MFAEGLANDPRFGIIPVVEKLGSGGSDPYKLVGFLGEFTYNIYVNKKADTKVAGVDAFIFNTALIETDGEPGEMFGVQPDPVIRLIK